MSEDNKAGLRRIYRKSWPYDNLFGSSRFELTSAQRGVWNDLLDFAKLGRVEPGLIAPAPDKAYSHTWLAEFFNVPLELLEETLVLLGQTSRVEENGSGIRILNWQKYQSEYDRQKPYRKAKKQRELPPEEQKKHDQFINEENQRKIEARQKAKVQRSEK